LQEGNCLLRDRAGPDKDSDKRQRAVIAAFAKAHGYAIVDEFYAAAVSGADPIAESVKAMLDRVAGNGVRCIVVESPIALPAIWRCSYWGYRNRTAFPLWRRESGLLGSRSAQQDN
jgi:hypothetical protein